MAAASIGEAIAMPMTARLLGRVGMTATLLSAALLNGVSMAALAFAHVSTGVLMLLDSWSAPRCRRCCPPCARCIRRWFPVRGWRGAVRP